MTTYMKIFLHWCLIYLFFNGKSHACDETHDLKKLSFPIVIFDGSIYKNVNCRAHIISSFLVVTATTCVNESSSEKYYVQVNREIVNDDSIDLSKLMMIKKIHYYYDKKSKSKNTDQLILAELNDRLPFAYVICIDWLEHFTTNLADYTDGGWILANVFDSHRTKTNNIDMKPIYGYPVSCVNSVFSSRKYFTRNEVCFRGESGNKSFLMKKGVGFYTTFGEDYYLKGIAIETLSEPNTIAVFTGLTKYLNWMNTTIYETNQAHGVSEKIRLPYIEYESSECTTSPKN